MTCPSQGAEQPSLFTDLDAPVKVPGRRNPPRKKAARQRELQVHLPIVQGEAAELLRMEDLVVSQRPLTRGDCEEEARPCPWVSCPWHVYWGRFEEFEKVIDLIEYSVGDAVRGGECTLAGDESIEHSQSAAETIADEPRVIVWTTRSQVACDDASRDQDPVHLAVANALARLFEQTEEDDGRARRPKTPGAVAAALLEGRSAYTFTAHKSDRLRSDVLSSSDVRGPWATCMLDVARDVRDGGGELEAEDTGRLLGITREAVRLIESRRARREFARSEELRPWLSEIVDESRLDEFAEFDQHKVVEISTRDLVELLYGDE